MEKNALKIDCHKCKHYFVTWEKRFPHGCRAMKFKGRALPSAIVFNSSNMACMLFVQKKLKGKARAKKSPKG